MPGITDMHCHILPGLDDGCQSMDETIQALREAERQQIKQIIVTPHYHPGRYMVSASQIMKTLDEVRRQCEKKGIDIALYPGQECYYYSGLTELLNSGSVLTLAESRYVLVEFSPDCLFTYLLSGLRDLRQNGYIPILAHFERYRCLQKEEHLESLKEQEYLLQMNFDTLLPKDGWFRKNPWRALAKSGVVDFLGSDCHGVDFRPLRVSEVYEWLGVNLNSRQRQQILTDNIQKILQNIY